MRGTQVIAGVVRSGLVIATIVSCVSARTSTAHAMLREHPQDRELSFRGEVDLQTIQVFVTDRRGDPVLGLTAEDFELIEAGRSFRPSVTIPTDEASLDVAIVLDLSESMSASMPTARHEVREFVSQLDADDCVLLVTSRAGSPGLRWASPREPWLDEAIVGGTYGGHTFLFDGIVAALAQFALIRVGNRGQMLLGSRSGDRRVDRADRTGCSSAMGPNVLDPRGHSDRRRALVVITDGGDTRSEFDIDDVIQASVLAAVPIIAVGPSELVWVGRADVSGQERSGASRLKYPVDLDTVRRLARDTGGQAIQSRRGGIAKVLLWLRGSYLLGYSQRLDEMGRPPGASGDPRRIEVRVLRDGARVIAPERHYAATMPASAGLMELAQGKWLVAEGRPAEAIEHLDAALFAAPDNAEGHFQKALALAQLSKGLSALASAKRATELEPGVGVAHYVVATLSAEHGRMGQAWEELVRAEVAGYDVGRLRIRLEQVSPPPAWVERQLRAPKIFVEVSPAPIDVLRIGDYRRIARVMRRLVVDQLPVGLSNRETADLLVTLIPADSDRRGDSLVSVRVVFAGRGRDPFQETRITVQDPTDNDVIEIALQEPLRVIANELAVARR